MTPTLSLLLALGPSLLGCYAFPCGSYDLQTGGVFDRVQGLLVDGDPKSDSDLVDVDGRYHEQCGRDWGTIGAWDPDGDGRAHIDFAVSDHALIRAGHSSPIELQLQVPLEWLYPGETATVPDLRGTAKLSDSSGAWMAPASLVEGTLEVLDGKGYDNPCGADGLTVGDGPVFTLRWDLRWDDGADVSYTAQGRDRIWMDAFGSPDCTGY